MNIKSSGFISRKVSTATLLDKTFELDILISMHIILTPDPEVISCAREATLNRLRIETLCIRMKIFYYCKKFDFFI